MTSSSGATRIRRASLGDTRIRRGSAGTDLFFMLAGISNLRFGGVTADVTAPAGSTFTTAAEVDITPSRDDVTVGVLLNSRLSATAVTVNVRVARGATFISEAINLTGFYRRQLFLDKPGTTAEQTYNFGLRRVSGTAAVLRAPSSIAVFEFGDEIVSDIRTSDLAISAGVWTDVASLSIAPPGPTARVRLQFLALSDSPDAMVRIRRGATTLVTAPNGTLDAGSTSGSQVGTFPGNFEDWVDAPGTAAEQTYTLQVRHASGGTIYSGTFLLAEPVD